MHPLNEQIFHFFEDEVPKYFEEQNLSPDIRWEQISMSQMVVRSLETKIPTSIEAKVGTGKTLAYLFPLLAWKKRTGSKGPAIIATSSTNLQEQILNKDLLLLRELGYSYTAVLAKGSQQYLCQYKFQNNKYKLKKRMSEGQINELYKWMNSTRSGDRSEVGDLDDQTWKLINIESTQDCTYCPLINECKYWRTRESFQDNNNDFIITNHGQLLQDLRMRYENPYKLLFSTHISAIVIDEAHNLEHAGVALFSSRFRINELQLTLERIFSDSKLIISSAKKESYLNMVLRFISEIKFVLKTLDETPSRIALPDSSLSTANQLNLIFKDLKDTMHLQIKNENNPLFERVERCIDFTYDIRSNEFITWFEPEQSQVVTLPREVSQITGDLLSHQYSDKQIPFIMTSATLSSNKSFDYFFNGIGQLGSDYFKRELPSPFDYKRQSLLYIPEDLHDYKRNSVTDEYFKSVDNRIEQLLTITDGHALILFTSHEHMERSYRNLCSKSLSWKLMKQTDGSKEHVSKMFKESTDSCVLFATGAFWEGFDIPGAQLINVIIVKLPFSPEDPYLAFKKEEAASKGLDPFNVVNVPDMIIKMKQGFGRLIRSKTDYGIVSILDGRVLDKARSYGQQLLSALPELNYTTSISQVESFVSSIRTSSFNYQVHYRREMVDFIPLPETSEPKKEERRARVVGTIHATKKVPQLKQKFTCSICGKDFFEVSQPESCLTPRCTGVHLIPGYKQMM
ncbi:ATP-dependent DNA helicase [Cohnella endophytica]|uniref:ATP-dependent DNA helicase n=1 Tax=Cohnella endophytica TaxID=2419778 RepID=A0A494XWP4_9BACL|nr:ATP-dependent DNA helicase [Cohnella endophytica]RKP54942.1 ATP-dependent DNA helicase [Cohnella endophytica]